jgi:prophage regulatory protein
MSDNFERDATPPMNAASAAINELDKPGHSKASNRDPRRPHHPLRILRIAEVLHQTGLGKTKLYALQADGSFPKGIKITSYAVGWIEDEVQAWIIGRVAASRTQRDE